MVPALADAPGDEVAADRLRRVVRIEAIVLVGALALTGALVAAASEDGHIRPRLLLAVRLAGHVPTAQHAPPRGGDQIHMYPFGRLVRLCGDKL